MFQFGTKSLLFAFALAAMWLSTLSGYIQGPDVRKIVLMIVFVSSGAAAAYSKGKPRAWWCGYFAVMLIMGTDWFDSYQPSLIWVDQLSLEWVRNISSDPIGYSLARLAIQDTLKAAQLLILACVLGFAAASIYSNSQHEADK